MRNGLSIQAGSLCYIVTKGLFRCFANFCCNGNVGMLPVFTILRPALSPLTFLLLTSALTPDRAGPRLLRAYRIAQERVPTTGVERQTLILVKNRRWVYWAGGESLAAPRGV